MFLKSSSLYSYLTWNAGYFQTFINDDLLGNYPGFFIFDNFVIFIIWEIESLQMTCNADEVWYKRIKLLPSVRTVILLR